jgi:hypothetical protein
MLYVVLGMHKSGTTLISKMLHESGVNMGQFDSLVTYDQGNQFERKEFQYINKHILKCGDLHSTDVITPLHKLYQHEDVGIDIKFKIKELDNLYEEWGFKDPRTCLTYDFWLKYLPVHKTIFVFRSPIEVWHHYQKKIPKYRFIKRFLSSAKAVKAWGVYNKQLLKFIEQSKGGGFIIEYSEFMGKKESVEFFSKFIGRKLIDTRDKSLYRAKSLPDLGYKIFNVIAKLTLKLDTDNLFSKLEDAKKKYNQPIS